jgi:phosphoserine phosphatase
MSESDLPLPLATAAELIQCFASVTESSPGIFAFDGDGTLWSGDVSDDVFFAAADAEWFHEDARAPMTAVLRTCGLDTHGSLGTLARRLYDAQTKHQVPERLLFEAMTYCYAGHTATEVTAFATQVLKDRGIMNRFREELRPILDWASEQGHECYLVSASPAPIVAVPAMALGFSPACVIASTATDEKGRIIDHMIRPIPYLEEKVVQLKERGHHRPLIAAFGDSPFDINLLQMARYAIAVEAKPTLLEALRSRAPGTVYRWLVNRSSTVG